MNARNFLLLPIFILPTAALTQSLSAQNVAVSNRLADTPTVRIDSFIFCGKAYKIPRECNEKSEANCCHYNNNPDQLVCLNGTTLVWTYFKNSWSARANYQNQTSHLQNQMKHYRKEPVQCILGDAVGEGYRLSFETKEGHKHYEIITYGLVNGHYVLIELTSSHELKKNKNIQPVFRQIVKLVM